ncbi:hypothetical protein FOZ63_001133 [Perkinsus olseni]|uniref:Uncharacterized protein n=1 Tax=Perkinsus olseni TaxID=32597 RepID=A0A7J6TMZ9_PEROL|nr:hypothetical protein FOZ63_001133 [Perkinsus olseni]
MSGITHYEYPPGFAPSEDPTSEDASCPTNQATIDDSSEPPVEATDDDGLAEDEMALELKELHEFLQSRGNADEAEDATEEGTERATTNRKPTKRAMRMAMKKAGKNKQAQGSLHDDAARVSASLASKISPSSAVLNPGSQGRTSRRLQDPYGCNTDTRH